MHAIKRAAVIGANGAIGRALVEQLSTRPGIDIIYSFARAATDFDSPQVSSHLIDYHNENSLAEAAKIADTLDLVLVTTGILHSATSKPEKSLHALSVDQFQELFLANSIVPAMLAKHFLPQLNKQNRSVFAALSARVGSISDNHRGGWYAYRASKAALNMMLKNAAIEIARSNKHAIIAGLHPGTVDSDLSKPFQANLPARQLFTPEKSARHLLAVVDGLTSEDSGKCFAWDGQEILP
jgi:NAD(P)-dependent dehydrogenase (short-subunit alcohol dehydrogenase family)